MKKMTKEEERFYNNYMIRKELIDLRDILRFEIAKEKESNRLNNEGRRI